VAGEISVAVVSEFIATMSTNRTGSYGRALV
jgi:hypothetical protein